MSVDRLFAVREEMEKAEARRLQPYFIRSFFMKAFETLGGTIHPREPGRFEVTFVPTSIRDRDRMITGRNTRDSAPVLKRYERVCFTKEAVRPLDRPGAIFGVLLHPGHPLMLAVSDLILEKNHNLMKQGSILVDPTDEGTDPWLMFLLTHEVKSGNDQVLSKRLQFIRVNPDGSSQFAGWAPHLDLEPLNSSDRPMLNRLLSAPWITTDMENRALSLASAKLVPEHFKEISERRIAHVDKTLASVHQRLTSEIDFWSDRYSRLREDLAAGNDVQLPLENIRRTILDLQGRLESRKKELKAMRAVFSATPVNVGGALVIPIGLLKKLRGEAPETTFAVDTLARSKIERQAMEAITRLEEAQGNTVVDVSAEKCGWDLTSYSPSKDGILPLPKHIEVKGRIKGSTTITVTRNEILYAFNQKELFVLAIVLVNEDGSCESPYYIRAPFQDEPGWGVASINYDLKSLLEKATTR
jgi:hypothetical protein